MLGKSITFAVILFAFLLLNHKVFKVSSSHFGINKKKLISGVISLILINISTYFFIWMTVRESQLFVIKNAFTDIHYIEQFLYYWLVVATVEEFCFRGILLNYFIRIFGGRKIISILLSSIIFGGMHIISGASILSAIIAGIVLGSIFVITENLIVVIGLHAFSHGMFGFRVEMIDNAISTSVHHDLSYAYIAVLIIVVVLIPLLSHVVEKKFFSGFAN